MIITVVSSAISHIYALSLTSLIASLGAIFYLIMDIIVQWGVYKKLRKEIEAKGFILLTAIVLDVVVLGAFLWIKGSTDLLLIAVAAIALLLIFFGEKWFLKTRKDDANA